MGHLSFKHNFIIPENDLPTDRINIYMMVCMFMYIHEYIYVYMLYMYINTIYTALVMTYYIYLQTSRSRMLLPSTCLIIIVTFSLSLQSPLY